MAKAYLGMNEEAGTGRPVLPALPNRSGKALGARILLPSETRGADETIDVVAMPDGTIDPETGGMSVCPTWTDLRPHQIPKWLKRVGPFRDATAGPSCRIWSHPVPAFSLVPPATSSFAVGLVLRVDKPVHGLVEPERAMHHAQYAGAIAATRPDWAIDEPPVGRTG